MKSTLGFFFFFFRILCLTIQVEVELSHESRASRAETSWHRLTIAWERQDRHTLPSLLLLVRFQGSLSVKMREIVHIQAGQCGNQIGS